MSRVRLESATRPVEDGEFKRLAFEAARRADAMGLVDPSNVRALDVAAVGQLVRSARNAGIARAPAFAFDNVDLPSRAEMADLLRLLISALEHSPAPKYEWRSVARVFEPEQLAALLGISVSSLRRYQAAARPTPDDVAARLHFLALIVGDLAGAYNEFGIRRWFDRERSLLGGRAPGALLSGSWDPDDPGPQKVRALAQSLATLSVT